MHDIYRTRKIEGQSIYGIIWNHSYHFVEIEVYNDGMISCWELVDLPGFREKLDRRWVVTSVPNDELLSIFQLGRYQIHDAHWKYDQEGYYNHVLDCIKSMNPTMENIHTFSQHEKKLYEKRRVIPSSHPVPYLREKVLYRYIDGKPTRVFCRFREQLYLTTVVPYTSRTIRVYGLPETMSFHFDELEKYFEEKYFETCIPEPKWITIEGLGTVLLRSDTTNTVKTDDKLLELKMTCQQLLEGIDYWGRMIFAPYNAYLRRPNETAKKQLKEAYESIPGHYKMFLDKIEKDIIRILYSDEKREV